MEARASGGRVMMKTTSIAIAGTAKVPHVKGFILGIKLLTFPWVATRSPLWLRFGDAYPGGP